jgi:hypothetical protein
MEKVRCFAIPINKKFFIVTSIDKPKEILYLGNFSYLIVNEDGDEYTSSNRWSFNYSIYEDDVEIEFSGKDISHEKEREYIFHVGVLTIKNPKSIISDTKDGLEYILTKNNRIYRIRPLYLTCRRFT